MAALTNRYEDDDSHRLPHGMKRVGYDEKTERYTFRQGDELWLGEPGSFYGGQMKWAGKVPDVSSSSDEDTEYEYDDENDTDSSEGSKDDKSFTKHASRVHKNDVETLAYFQESNNEWGVPIASISDTKAKPAGTSLKRKGTQLKRAVTAIRVTKGWSRKKVSSGNGDQGASPVQQGNNEEKREIVGPHRNSFTEKGLPTLPPN